MFYKVSARLKENTAGELRRKLLDGTIENQKPDGQEIVASMRRAVKTKAGDIEWSEVCYCQRPLDHERTTVYDLHFSKLRTEAIDGYKRHEGRPFMELLDELASVSGGE